MKKNVDFISLDSSLAQWLSEQLRTCAPRTRRRRNCGKPWGI